MMSRPVQQSFPNPLATTLLLSPTSIGKDKFGICAIKRRQQSKIQIRHVHLIKQYISINKREIPLHFHSEKIHSRHLHRLNCLVLHHR